MKYIYPQTIFINEDGEIMEKNYNRTEYFQKKQWYERRIEKGNKVGDDKTINQRFVQLEKTKTKQLELELK